MQEKLPPFSEQAKQLKVGVYEHYTGKQYTVIGVSRHSESLEEYVVYQAHYSTNDIWIRPLSMFIESVFIDGKEIPRFRFIGL